MLVSYKWLQELIDIEHVSVDELADKLSRTGIEVEEVNRAADGLKKLVVGDVRECVPHANSDHLSVCQVDVGEEELYQIVCGAPNVAAGQKVIVALPGARIVGNIKIKKSKMRGEVSQGMICSLEELGFPEKVIPKAESDGIFVLPEEAKPGESIFPYLDMNDPIIELSVTPNRADALSMRGVAHEVGAIYREKPHFEKVTLKEDLSKDIRDYLTVTVDSKEDTPNYRMRMIEGVKVKRSPLWLESRLMHEGIRPVNNIVDVTNYVLLLFGQPLHAFDYEALGSREILVRRAFENETLTTLDEVERKLGTESIVVTNGREPVALAGVMGGYDSEITEKTTVVALEAASFDPSLTRKTATKHGLRSESSARFEKGINLGTIEEALDYAAMMIAELGEGTVIGGQLIGSETAPEEVAVTVSLDYINRVLGTSLSEDEVSEIFTALDFPFTVSDAVYTVDIPSRRWDIKIPADIVEEVARIYGYDRLPSTLPSGEALPGRLTRRQFLTRQMRHALEGAGLSEVISYALTTPEKATQFTLEELPTVALSSPMSVDHSVLRQSLASGMLDDIAYNQARKQLNNKFYEIGNTFISNGDHDLPEQREHLVLAISGLTEDKNWQGTQRLVNYYDLKGVVERVLNILGVTNVRYHALTDLNEMHPGRTAGIYVGETLIGFVGQVHPVTAKSYEIKETYLAELDLARIFELEVPGIEFEEVSKYPAISRDIALLVHQDVTHEMLVETIKQNGGAYLKEVVLFDIFTGEKLGLDKKSMAYSLTFQNSEETLVDDVVNAAMNKIEKALVAEHQAEIR